MDDLQELFLRNVRCFQDAQRVSVRPITLLVGENSTGKTTFMGCYSVLHQMFRKFDIDGQLDFNQEPFAMGSFRDIVRARRGPEGRIDEFQLGFTIHPAHDKNISSYQLIATFREGGSQPVISAFRFEFQSNAFLEMERIEDRTIVRIPGHDVETHAPLVHVIPILEFVLNADDDKKQIPSHFLDLQPVAKYLGGLLHGGVHENSRIAQIVHPNLPELIPVAPLRSKPKRTYDPVRETASPEGAHIPMLMMRLNRTNREFLGFASRYARCLRRRLRVVLGHQGQGPRRTDERPIPIADQDPRRTAGEHHGRWLRRESESADCG